MLQEGKVLRAKWLLCSARWKRGASLANSLHILLFLGAVVQGGGAVEQRHCVWGRERCLCFLWGGVWVVYSNLKRIELVGKQKRPNEFSSKTQNYRVQRQSKTKSASLWATAHSSSDCRAQPRYVMSLACIYYSLVAKLRFEAAASWAWDRKRGGPPAAVCDAASADWTQETTLSIHRGLCCLASSIKLCSWRNVIQLTGDLIDSRTAIWKWDDRHQSVLWQILKSTEFSTWRGVWFSWNKHLFWGNN